MAVSPGCVAAVQEASGGQFTPAEAEAVILRVEQRRNALLAQGQTANLDQRLAELAAADAEQVKIAAALARKHAALNAIVRDRLEATIAGHVADGLTYPSAVLAVLEGVNRNVQNGRLSVANVRRGFESMFLHDMAGTLQRDVPTFWKQSRSRAFNDNIVREMYELREDGTPGITKDKDAMRVAEIFRDYTELSRRNLNQRGANIGKLDGWAGPQAHDAARMLKAGQQAWVDTAMEEIDLGRTFDGLTPEDARAVLADVYTTIVTGRDNKLSAAEKGEFTGPANVAKAISRHRVLHFKDADAWLRYNERYGNGHIVGSIYNHQRHAAKLSAQMQLLGPNPEVMYNSLLESLTRRIRNDGKMTAKQKEKMIRRLQPDSSDISSAMAEMQGLTSTPAPDQMTAARINSGIRAGQSMAKLGSALASQFNDLAVGASSLKYNGVGFLESYGNQFRALIRGRTPAEQKEIAFYVGEYGDGMLDAVVNRFSPDDGVPGFMQRAQTTFFKMNGMTWATNTSRGALGQTLSAFVGRQTGKGWDRLPRGLKNELMQYGIRAAEWDVIRQGNFRALNGKTYVTGDRIRDIPLEEMDGLVEGTPTEAKRMRARDDLEIKLRTYFTDQIMSGIIEPTARSRRWLLKGTRPGSRSGEFWRHVSQFKGFPTAYIERPLGRAFAKGTPAAVRVMHVGHLLAASTAFGYLSLVAKDYLMGYEPRDPLDPKTMMAAFLQGGGIGIMGDFIFGQARHDQGALETMMGPALGTAGQVLKMWYRAQEGDIPSDADWFNVLVQNTPGQNLWWAKGALNALFLDAIRENMSPGWQQRRDTRRLNEYGQERAY